MSDSNVPARTDGPKELTVAEKQRARIDALVKAVEDKSDQLATLLQDSGVDFRRFVEVFRRALIQNEDLLRADAGSLLQSCMNACTDGLLPDGRQGALVVYSVNVAKRGEPKNYVKKAQWIPMVQGLLQVAYASGNFRDIQARVVYEGDSFDYGYGIEPWVEHKPGRRAARGEGMPDYPVIAAYAVARTKDGGTFVEVFEGDDIQRVRAVSRATGGPWASWSSEMIRKGPLRRMWKYLPKNARMERIIDHDDENFSQDILIPDDATAERKLTAGFAKPSPALEHAPAETVDIPMDQVLDGDMVPVGDWEEEAEAAEPKQREAPSDGFAPRIREYRDRVAAAQSWLNIKQALRGLLKAQDWDRGADERLALSIAWDRFTELGDKTDFVTDVFLYACWLAGRTPEPSPDEVTGNLKVLQTQADWNRAGDDIQAWVLRAATGRPQ